MIFDFINAWDIALEKAKGDRNIAITAILIAIAIVLPLYCAVFYAIAFGITGLAMSLFGIKLSFWVVFWALAVGDELLGLGRYYYKHAGEGDIGDDD